MNGGWLRAAGAEETLRPGRLIGCCWAARQLYCWRTPGFAVDYISASVQGLSGARRALVVCRCVSLRSGTPRLPRTLRAGVVVEPLRDVGICELQGSRRSPHSAFLDLFHRFFRVHCRRLPRR